MDWMKILSAIAIIAMLVYLGPRLFQMMKHSPKADRATWMQAIVPLAAVVGFVALLMAAVSGV